jgi:hypothetical protein
MPKKPAIVSELSPALRYVGPGFIPGIPARDLSPEEVAALAPVHTVATLTRDGLYTEAASAPAADAESADQEGDN